MPQFLFFCHPQKVRKRRGECHWTHLLCANKRCDEMVREIFIHAEDRSRERGHSMTMWTKLYPISFPVSVQSFCPSFCPSFHTPFCPSFHPTFCPSFCSSFYSIFCSCFCPSFCSSFCLNFYPHFCPNFCPIKGVTKWCAKYSSMPKIEAEKGGIQQLCGLNFTQY